MSLSVQLVVLGLEFLITNQQYLSFCGCVSVKNIDVKNHPSDRPIPKALFVILLQDFSSENWSVNHGVMACKYCWFQILWNYLVSVSSSGTGVRMLKVRPVSVTTEGRVQFSGISVGEPPVQLLKHISFHIGS